ncbi:MAG TPA: HEPN domain-containing protein [Chthonomonadales bacterium]|nr:HEPN domain-containing protein [Chthonomonadales bacterium]
MPLEDSRPWLSAAADDLQAAALLVTSGSGPAGPICSHCQQAAEKALKALIAFDHEIPARTHDLASLARNLAARSRPVPQELRAPAYSLSSYAVDVRYPGQSFAPDSTDVASALEAAANVVRWTLDQLGVDCADVGLGILEKSPFRGISS